MLVNWKYTFFDLCRAMKKQSHLKCNLKAGTLGKNAVDIEKKNDVHEYLVSRPYDFCSNSEQTMILLSVCFTLIFKSNTSKDKSICNVFQNKLLKKRQQKAYGHMVIRM